MKKKKEVGCYIRRCVCLGGLLCLLFSFGGCNDIDRYKTGEDEQNSRESSFAAYDYNQEKAQQQSREQMAVAPKGYYYTASRILQFYDIENDLNTAVCSKVGCSHKDEGCDAYVYDIDAFSDDLSCSCFGSEVFYYNDKLYMVERNKDGEYFLIQYDSNFNSKEIVATLASYKGKMTTLKNPKASLISENYLYYYIYSFTKEDYENKNYNATYDCMRVKLEVGAEPEKLGAFTFPSDYTMAMGTAGGMEVLISGNDIYYIAGGTNRFYTNDHEVQGRVARYSKTSGKFELLWSHIGSEAKNVWGSGTDVVEMIDSNACMDDAGNLYLLNKKPKMLNNSIAVVNFDTQTSKNLYTTPYTSIEAMDFDGELLYLLEHGENECYLTALDTSGNVVSRQKLAYAEEYLAMLEKTGQNAESDGLIFYGVDNRYIMIGARKDIYEGLISARFAYPYKRRDTVNGAGIIDKASFLKGEPIQIKQIYQYNGD